MPKYPQTFAELQEADYQFQNDSKCRECKLDIEWWKTKGGTMIPFNPMPPPSTAPAIPHWKTCREKRER